MDPIWLNMATPIIGVLAMLLIFHKKTTIAEYLLQFGIPMLLIVICVAIAKAAQSRDTEYLSSYYTQACYEEAWNERVSCRHPKYRTVTESYRDSNGKTHTRTKQVQDGYRHPYDVDDHPERWYVRDNCDGRNRISRGEFERLAKLWGMRKFKDLHRSYHTRDGYVYFNGVQIHDAFFTEMLQRTKGSANIKIAGELAGFKLAKELVGELCGGVPESVDVTNDSEVVNTEILMEHKMLAHKVVPANPNKDDRQTVSIESYKVLLTDAGVPIDPEPVATEDTEQPYEWGWNDINGKCIVIRKQIVHYKYQPDTVKIQAYRVYPTRMPGRSTRMRFMRDAETFKLVDRFYKENAIPSIDEFVNTNILCRVLDHEKGIEITSET